MRLYNGCPDDELKAVLDAKAAVHKEAAEFGIRITWFPVEEKYSACTSMASQIPYRELSGFHSTEAGALAEAKTRL